MAIDGSDLGGDEESWLVGSRFLGDEGVGIRRSDALVPSWRKQKPPGFFRSRETNVQCLLLRGQPRSALSKGRPVVQGRE